MGTFRGLALDLSVPGGALLPVLGVSSLAVVPAHRRRGILSALMAHGLNAAVERGEAAAVLHSAEYPVYGRYGFAPATRHGGFTVDVTASGGLRPGLDISGSLRETAPEEVRRLGPALFDEARRNRAGAVSRPEWSWRRRTGAALLPGEEWDAPTVLVHQDGAGQVRGLVAYTVDGKWSDRVPDATLTVTDLIATTAQARRALWAHLLSVDWGAQDRGPGRRPGRPAAAPPARPARRPPAPHPADCLWLRLLDLPAALTARTYPPGLRLTLRVADPAGHVDGTWLLRTGADGSAEVTPDGGPAGLALDAAALAALHLGGEQASRLAAAGLATELTPGAARLADTLFRTSAEPWCPDHF
ncbi:GNAT family N-acetyltransferase [Streptomyces albidoflavus]|uniref:GNAT family N-acetyltransferase n=1 Tax=Streptomyces albidoflavus TaxID=1886 RepID=UPI0033C2AE86